MKILTSLILCIWKKGFKPFLTKTLYVFYACIHGSWIWYLFLRSLELNKFSLGMFVGPCPHRDRNYHIESNFWKFYLIKIGFTLHEPVSLVKVFRLFKSEQIFLVFGVWTQYVDVQHLGSTSYLLAGPACLWCLVLIKEAPLMSCILQVYEP